MKKVLFSIGLSLLIGTNSIKAQNLLEGVLIEKITPSSAAFSAGVTAGATTYRIYIDMAPDTKLLDVYANNDHSLIFNTVSTNYYNSASDRFKDNGDKSPNKATLYDSWISFGAASGSTIGIYGSADINGSTTPYDPSILGIQPALDASFGTAATGELFEQWAGTYSVVGGI